jgi:hypothetical protein
LNKNSKNIYTVEHAAGPREMGQSREQWLDEVRSLISKDLTEEDAEDREFWRSKVSLW